MAILWTRWPGRISEGRKEDEYWRIETWEGHSRCKSTEAGSDHAGMRKACNSHWNMAVKGKISLEQHHAAAGGISQQGLPQSQAFFQEIQTGRMSRINECGWKQVGEEFGFGGMILEPVEIAQVTSSKV